MLKELGRHITLNISARGRNGSLFLVSQDFIVRVEDVESEALECAMPCTYNSDTATNITTDSFVYNNGVQDFVVITYNDLGNGWRCYPLHGINGRLDHYINWEGSSGYADATSKSGFIYNDAVCGDVVHCLTPAFWGDGVSDEGVDPCPEADQYHPFMRK